MSNVFVGMSASEIVASQEITNNIDELYVCWNKQNNCITQGPKQLSNELSGYTHLELRSLGWYRAVVVYDREDYNVHVHDIVSSTCSLDETQEEHVVVKNVITTFRSLSEVQSYVNTKLTAFRDIYILRLGFIYDGILFDSDEEAKMNWSAYISALNANFWLNGVSAAQVAFDPTEHEWTSYNNSTVFFLSLEIIQCGLYFMQWASSCYIYCRTLKNSVLVCTNPSDAWDIYKANNDYLWPSRDLGGTLTLKYKTIPPAV